MLSENKFLNVLLKALTSIVSAHPHAFGSIKKVLLLFEAIMSSEFRGKLGTADYGKSWLLPID
jgi:hypothetical protein